MTNQRPFVTTEEVQELTGIPAGTLRYWIHIGIGPKSFKLGPRRRVYKLDDVNEWIQEQYDAENAAS